MKGITRNPAIDAYQRAAITPVRPTQQARPGETARGKLGSPEAAKVTISAEARQLASTADANDVNTQKIEAIRAAMNEGTLRIDAHVVADKMVAAAGE